MPLNHTHEGARLERYVEGIFARRFYANHGPLESEAEHAIAAAVGTRHASLIANDMLALILALRATVSSGEVLLPSLAPRSTLDAVRWAGLQPALIDVGQRSPIMDLSLAARAIGGDTKAMTVVDFASISRDVRAACEFAHQHALRLVWDARMFSPLRLPHAAVPDALVLSFGDDQDMPAAVCGAIATNDEFIWKRVRTSRSFHESQTFHTDCLRFNAKASELQAAIVLSQL